MNLAFFTLAASNPVDHVTDKPLIEGELFGIHGWLISNVTVLLVLSALITLVVLIPAARRITTGKSGSLDDLRAKGVWANLVEFICLYLRDETFRPVLRDETDRYAPMLWTFFWFILINNLLGLIPLLDITALFGWGYHGHGIGGTATQSIWVTGALACCSFLLYNGIAIAKDPVGWMKHMTAGAPIYMWPIMVPVELMGMFVKPVALALRLFANMTGGHIIIAVLFSFVVGLATGLGGMAGHGLAIIPLLGAVAIFFLEILVAFIQAFIFTFLTCLFLGQLVAHHHDDHGHEQEHGEHAGDHGQGHKEALAH